MNLDSQHLIIAERASNMVLCFHPHFLMRDFTCASLRPAKPEYIRYHIVAFPSIARHTHMCKHVLLLRFTLHHMFIVGVWFPLFLYNCVLYRIIELNLRNTIWIFLGSHESP
jgi:hypothetical protein